MNKFISNKIILQLIIVVLVLLSSNLYFEKRQVQRYANEKIAQDIGRAIREIEEINKIIPKLLESDKVNGSDFEIKDRNIGRLGIGEREILKIFHMKDDGFSWDGLTIMSMNVYSAVEKEKLSKEDKEYLNKILKYNSRIVEAYNTILEKYMAEDGGWDSVKKNMKKILKDFYKEGNRINKEENYDEFKYYDVEE